MQREKTMLFLLFTLTTEDKNIVDTLFSKQQKKFYSLSYYILGSQQDAEDAIGDAFIRIIDNFEKIKKLPCHKTVPFCVVIVRNCCITILRKRKRAIPTELTEDIADDGLPIEDSYFKKEDAAQLASLMSKLSPTDRQVLCLRHMDGMSYREIGKLLDIAEASARKREERAMERLRKLYGVGKNEE